MTRPPGRALALAGLGALGITLGAALAEAAVRLADRTIPSIARLFRGSDPLGILVEPHGESGYRQRPGAVYHYFNGSFATSNSAGYRGPVVEIPKAPGTFRIVLLGGSTTHGWGVGDDSTIDAHMRRLLASRYPERRFEVVNLGFDGYDSWQDYERLRTDGLPLEPDLVILNSGINDVRNARYPDLIDQDPRTQLWAADLARLREEQRTGRHRPWTLVKHYVMLARLPGILRDRVTAAPAKGDSVVVPHPEAADYFERNVKRLVALVTARGIPVLLSTPPSSLGLPGHTESASGRTYWVGTAEVTQRYRDELDRRLRRIADSLRSGAVPVAYVAHSLPLDLFLDDCHLTPAGNGRMAEDFVAAAAPYFSAPSSATR